jgi:hypothetical protein
MTDPQLSNVYRPVMGTLRLYHTSGAALPVLDGPPADEPDDGIEQLMVPLMSGVAGAVGHVASIV